MKLTELVNSGAIVHQLAAKDRDSAIAELVDSLVVSNSVLAEHRQTMIDELLVREKRMTTGFGQGIAVPHAKHDVVRRVCAAVGLSQGGLDFSSADGAPVYIIFLLLSPKDKPEDHLQAMEAVFEVLGRETFRRLLRQSSSAEEIRSLLEEADTQQI
jgi:mannitol/fructose-specific phosphotransferase system IIA component (Ntr-type)